MGKKKIMADSGISKAAKKNKKRNKKKANPPPEDNQSIAKGLLEKIKDQLDVAKIEKNHVLANKLRQQLWVVTDIASGVKPDMPEEEFFKVVSDLPLSYPDPAEAAAATTTTVSMVTPTEKKITSLRKKIDQIETLKKKQADGVKLEANQLTKIES